MTIYEFGYTLVGLLEQALNQINNLKEDEKFLLKDLYRGYEWKRIEPRQRQALGYMFLDYISKNNVSVIAVEKTTAKQQVYRKGYIIRMKQ